MELNATAAVQLYQSAKPATKPEAKTADTAFLDIVADFAETVKAGEDTAKAAMTGDADIPSLVTALAQSELAVETAVTIRDKVVEAYQEILRMPV